MIDFDVDYADTIPFPVEQVERPHCLQREADLFAAMDDMGAYATRSVQPLTAEDAQP